MQKKRYTGYIVGAVLILLGIYVIVTYNSLVKKEEKVKQQWSEVQNTYQRRLDLVPNLVNVVKGVSDFEQTTLENIAAARSKAISGQTDEVTADNYNKQQVLQDSLAAATNKLIVIIEKYPVLKGTSAYSGLQTQLEGTERRIKVARNDFNASVAEYNTAVRGGSSMVVSKLFGFKPKEGFQAVAGSDKAVEIKF
ncbi:MAG: LemA family protein [Gloeobacteraceae cyanobacterium ES-bin-316]|nr:LemA family protein [Ferruginibacter sp.]